MPSDNPISATLASLSKVDEELAELDADARVKLLRQENARLRRKLEKQEAGVDIIKYAFDQAYQEPLDVVVSPLPRKSKKKHVEEAILHLTDLHIGKLTRSYSTEIAGERLQSVHSAISRIITLRRNASKVDKLYILMGGDFVEGGGNIFPRQPHEIDQDLIEQAIKIGPTYVANLILSLAQVFPEIHITGVLGNHGRVSKFAARRTNIDGIFYEVVRKIVEATRVKNKITWDLPFDESREFDPWWSHVRVCSKWGVLLVHGDQIRGQLGYPWYGVGKKARGWADDKRMPPWDYLFMGHFHTRSSFSLGSREVISTGALESDNDYAAESLASCSDPQQRLCIFTEERGMIVDHLLYLTDRTPNT